jgi:putative sigma-54 modulation protein
MIINLQTVHFKASPDLEAYVHDKVGKLFEHNSSIIHADIILSEGGSGNPENKWCEITLSIPGNNLVAKKSAAVYEKSIAEAVEALLKIMRRKKEIAVTQRRH